MASGRDTVSIGVLSALAACATQPRFDGPLPVRSQHPAQLAVLQIAPQPVTPPGPWQAELRLDTAYSSLFLGGQGGGNDFYMDGELARSAARMRYGLGNGLELGFELAAIHSGGGFLDEFIIDWHEFWGFPDQGREQAPKDAFLVQAREQGDVVYTMQRENWTLCDIPLTFGWAPVVPTAERPYGFKLTAAADAPTGNDARGYGSGDWEFALGAHAELWTGAVAWTGHVQHTLAETPRPGRDLGFEFADVTAAGLAAQIALDDTWTLLGQVSFETSTLRRLGFIEAERDQWLLWVGTRARLTDRIGFELVVGEDLEGRVAPDFTAYASFVLSLGGSGGRAAGTVP